MLHLKRVKYGESGGCGKPSLCRFSVNTSKIMLRPFEFWENSLDPDPIFCSKLMRYFFFSFWIPNPIDYTQNLT